MKSYSPCFLIPCYNHGNTLWKTVDDLMAFHFPILIVDDASDASTKSVLEKIGQNENVIVITLSENQGKGGAVMAGIEKALSLSFTHAFQIDADGQHDILCVPNLIETSKKNPGALVSGKPVYDASIPKSRLYGRSITHFWVTIETLSTTLKDTMCGFRAYPLSHTWKIIQSNKIGKRMDFDTDIMVRLYWDGCEVEFIDIKVIYPPNGVSHFNLFRDNVNISTMHTRLFFGMIPKIPRLLSLKRKHASALKKSKTPPFDLSPHWSQRKERGTYLGIKCLLSVYKFLGKRTFSVLLRPVIFYYWLSATSARHASKDFLKTFRAYAKSQGRPLPKGLNSYQHLLSFGETMLDKLAAWQGDFNDSHLNITGGALFHDTVKKKKGAILLGSHLGNIELCRALGRHHTHVKINALVFTEHAKQFQNVLDKINPQACVNVISVSKMGPETAMILQEKLDQGEWIVITGDRTSATREERVLMADFLGRPAPFPQGPFILASVLKAPVFLLFATREKGGNTPHFNVNFESFYDPIILPRKDREAALKKIIEHYAKRLEHYTLKTPLQWYNFYNFWQLTSVDNDIKNKK